MTLVRSQEKKGEKAVESSKNVGSQLLTMDAASTHKKAPGMQQKIPTLSFPLRHTLCGLYRLWSGEDNKEMNLPLFSGVPPFLLSAQAMEEEAEIIQKKLTALSMPRWQAIVTAMADRTLPDLDGEIFFHISRDKMVAWLLLLPPIGQGKPVEMLHLMKLLSEEKVDSGIEWDLVKEMVNQGQYFQLLPVAWGKQPERGADGWIEDYYARDQEPNMEVEELAQVGYDSLYSLHLVQEVKKGDAICRIIPPGQGIPGSTVTGERVPALNGRPAIPPKGRNTELSEDGNYIVSTKDGHVLFNGRTFQVKPVLKIEGDVTPEDGTVQFVGDIQILGDVVSGASVQATGSIQVNGMVEASTIEAGEHVVVSGGIQGQDNALIRAYKSVYAKYLEHCTVYAFQRIQADCIIESEIFSNGTIQVRTGRAVIVGGHIQAAGEISVGTVGSKAERITTVVLGGQPCEALERAQMMEELNRTEEKLRKVSSQPASPEVRKEISQLNLNVCVTKMKLEKLEKDLKKSEVHFRKDCRLVCDTVFPGTEVTIGGNTLLMDRMKERCAFCPGKNKVNLISVV